MNANDNIVQLENPARPTVAANSNSLGALLIAAGKITVADAERVMKLQHQEGWRFGEAALRLSLINESDLIQALHKQYDLPLLLPGNAEFGDDLVAAYQPYHRRTDEIRALRMQLLIRWFRKPDVRQPVLAIVSPGNGEGRSYVAANLAVLFSQLGMRTLLIDADMRNPRQHRIFNISDRTGLSAVLSGRTPPTDAAIAISGLTKLTVLPAGAAPPNPLELLARPELPALFKEYLEDFDVVIADTPPALRYSDAQTIAFHAGSAIVLARKDHTRIGETQHVVTNLGDSGAFVVGTVMNVF